MEELITNTGIGQFAYMNNFDKSLGALDATTLIVEQGQVDWVSITIAITLIGAVIFVVLPMLAILFIVVMMVYYISFFLFAWLPFILFYLTVLVGGFAFLWVYID